MGSEQRVASNIRYQSKGRNHVQRAMLSALAFLIALSLFSVTTVAAYADDSVTENTPAETPAALIPASSELETQEGELAEIVLEVEENGYLAIANKWINSIDIYQNGSFVATVTGTGAGDHSYGFSVKSDDIIRVKETTAGTFRTWNSSWLPLAEATACRIISMPAISSFTTDAQGTIAGDHFFSHFNYGGSLTSLPTDSFDTSNIMATGDLFFNMFNDHGKLTSLPTGSFDTSNIMAAGDNFFANFNASGSLTSLPTGSFDTSNIMAAGDLFFCMFNDHGKLTSLPTGSFDTSSITTTENYFFSSFNAGGSLTSLPTGSFDTSGITSPGWCFFESFDRNGKLLLLPSSFKLPEAISSMPAEYCTAMFNNSALTKGNEAVPLYFAFEARDAFSDTDILPASPPAEATVYVNGCFSLAEATIAPIANQSYTGSALKPALEVMFNGTALVEGTDYTAVYTNNTNAGTATVTITGMGNYDEDLSASFTIVAAGSNDTIPQTGDANTPLLLWGALLSILAFGVLAGPIKRRCRSAR